jgi:predicted transcriptional regulator
MMKKKYFGELELQVLNQFKKGSSLSLKQVHSKFENAAYTTIQTVMNRLVKKGILTRTKEDRVYLYSMAKSKYKSPILERFKSLFSSDQMMTDFVVHLIGQEKLSQKELKKIQETIEKKLKK